MAKQKDMSVRQWINAIKADCQALDVYKPAFDPAIRMLAEVMVQRQAVWEQYEDGGCQPMITGTNKNGSEYMAKNPLLSLWDDLTKTALGYRRELGLTPAGLKKLNEKAMMPRKKSALAEALKQLE